MFLALHPQTDADLARAYMREHLAADQALIAGRLDDARLGFERCRELAPLSPTIAYALACVTARAGDLDRAFAALEDARSLGFRDASLAEWDEDLASLKHDPRWSLWLAALPRSGPSPADEHFPWLALAPEQANTTRAPFTTAAEVSVPAHCIVVGDSRGGLTRIALVDGSFECDYESLGGPIWRVATHPTAPEFAVLTTRGELAFFRCDDSKPFARSDAFVPDPEPRPQRPFLAYLEYSPDGSRIASCSAYYPTDRRAGTVGCPTVVWSSAGTKLWERPPQPGNPWYVELAWTSDGVGLASGEGSELVLHAAVDGAELDRLATPARVLCARFDPSGARLATGHEDATVRLWDARTFEQIGHARVSPSLFDQERDVNSVAFTLDGSRLAYAACEAVGIGVLDSATGVVLREPEDGDGHWCEPVGLLLDRDASNVWWSEGCGGGAIERVSLDRPSHVLPISGATPRANASGRAVIASGLGIACFDVARGRVIWVRPTHVGTDVIQAQSGHFGVLPLDPEALYVDRKRNGAVRDPVWWHARTLFDPKRVRASLAGVELVLWRY